MPESLSNVERLLILYAFADEVRGLAGEDLYRMVGMILELPPDDVRGLFDLAEREGLLNRRTRLDRPNEPPYGN